MRKKVIEVGKEMTVAKCRNQRRSAAGGKEKCGSDRCDTPRDVSIKIRLFMASGTGGEFVVGDSDDRPIVALLASEVVDSSS